MSAFLIHFLLLSAPPILLTQGTALPRRSFFRRSRFALEKSRGTSRRRRRRQRGLIRGPERPRCTSVRPGPGLVIRPAGQFFFRLLSPSLPLLPVFLYLYGFFLRFYPAPLLALTSSFLSNGGTGINLYAVRVCTPLFLAVPRNLQETSRTLRRPLACPRRRTRAIVPARRRRCWRERSRVTDARIVITDRFN